jgi:hypothetical protein
MFRGAEDRLPFFPAWCSYANSLTECASQKRKSVRARLFVCFFRLCWWRRNAALKPKSGVAPMKVGPRIPGSFLGVWRQRAAGLLSTLRNNR